MLPGKLAASAARKSITSPTNLHSETQHCKVTSRKTITSWPVDQHLSVQYCCVLAIIWPRVYSNTREHQIYFNCPFAAGFKLMNMSKKSNTKYTPDSNLTQLILQVVRQVRGQEILTSLPHQRWRRHEVCHRLHDGVWRRTEALLWCRSLLLQQVGVRLARPCFLGCFLLVTVDFFTK